VAGLVVAAVLFALAGQIQYAARPGQLGPDFWPKLAIGLMAIVCVIEIARVLLGARGSAQGIADLLDRESEAGGQPRSQLPLLAGGIGLLALYAVVVTVLGFLLSTFLFLAAFMYLGRYRNHVAIWSVAAGLTGAVALVFLRFAYVSLPRGVPPFDQFTDLLRTALGG